MSYDATDDRASQRRFAAMESGTDERYCEACDRALAGDEDCAFHLRVVCSWCKKPMGYKPCDEEMDGQISHGVCKPCGAAFINQMGSLILLIVPYLLIG